MKKKEKNTHIGPKRRQTSFRPLFVIVAPASPDPALVSPLIPAVVVVAVVSIIEL